MAKKGPVRRNGQKGCILAAVKQQWRERVTTVFVKQGHYATNPNIVAAYPHADITVKHIADLLDYEMDTLMQAANTS